jgi:SAM-dependent methyltransferase
MKPYHACFRAPVGCDTVLFRSLLEAYHPQGIPWPCSHFYNAISRSLGFQSHYILVAKDILSCWSEDRALDLGTGPGWLLIEIHHLCPALHLTGVDISPAMVRRARMKWLETSIGQGKGEVL